MMFRYFFGVVVAGFVINVRMMLFTFEYYNNVGFCFFFLLRKAKSKPQQKSHQEDDDATTKIRCSENSNGVLEEFRKRRIFRRKNCVWGLFGEKIRENLKEK